VAWAQMKPILQDGFELHPLEEPIAGRVTGGHAWRVAGMMEGDLAVVTAADAFEGKQSLLLSDMSAGRVRAILDLPSMKVGSVAFAIKEHANDEGRPDAYSVSVGAVSISRKADGESLWFSVGKGRGQTIKFSGGAHRYAPEQWNRMRVEFDDTMKSAAFFINDVEVARLEETTANFTVSSVMFATYSSASTGDTIFIDDIVVSTVGEN